MDTLTKVVNVLGIIYVALPLIFLFILALLLLLGKKVSKESLATIIDVSKWYMVSVAIIFAAKVIETGFSERETGIKEVQIYDKYVETILKADNIEGRWLLAEYFSIVTPTERLRNRWMEYKKEIKDDYDRFLELRKVEEELSSKDTLSQSEKEKYDKVINELKPFDKKLITTNTGRWVVVFTGSSVIAQAETELSNLIKAGIENPSLYIRNNSFRAISKIFYSKDEAVDYLESVKRIVRDDIYVVDLNKWCPNEVFNGKYFECK